MTSKALLTHNNETHLLLNQSQPYVVWWLALSHAFYSFSIFTILYIYQDVFFSQYD